MTISPGAIVLEPGALTRGYTRVDRLAHTGADVTMLKARWMPPFINTRLVVEDGDVVAMASMPGWFRGRLRRALLDAGFQVRERFGWSL